ncbi:MAG: long-chain fatty acid transporter [Pedobacter sp.]|jgi:long-chain fatty acid transport protein|nr:long-chain fatty acid transporter [Pedobacter sp.]
MKKILLSLFVILPFLGFSQSFQVNLQGQKQTAMGGTGTGYAQDEAAVFFNPGAVSLLEGNGVMGGIHALYLRSAFQQAGSGVNEYNKDRIATPFQAYAVYGAPASKLKFGLGIYTPFGGAMHWDENWSGKFTVTSLDLQAIYIQPTLSYKLTDEIGVGAGLVYALGKVDLQRAIPINQSNGESSTAQLKGTSKDFGFNAGVYFKDVSGLSIGLTYRSKVNAHVKDGDANFNVPEVLQSGFPTKFNATLPLPATTSIGFGYQATDNTVFALDVNWVSWHAYKALAFDYDNNATIEDTNSPRNYKDAGTVRFGVQNQYSPKLALRAGIGYALTPVKEGYVTPEVPDANRLLLSAGVGYRATENLNIDFSFLYENIKARTETNLETNLSGTFKTVVYIPGLSISYKF